MKIRGLLHVSLTAHVQRVLLTVQVVVKILVILLMIAQAMVIAVHYHGLVMDLKTVKIRHMAVI